MDSGAAVVILGPQAAGDLVTAVRLAAARGQELVIVSVGYPPTERQRAAVARAIDHAIRLAVRCEAVVAGSPEALSGTICPGDTVAPMAAGAALEAAPVLQ
ncbi:MAG TPA: hypothetical protein VHA57_02940 [Actinomycetota bacterium]|nr:hypothetical protein [Actinomycetota bacterium]